MKRLMLLLLLLGCLTSAALAEDAEAFAALHLPGYTPLDGCILEDTAMLLLEDGQGQTFFAGCVREGEDWAVTLSTPVTDWQAVGLDTYHAGEGSILLTLAAPSWDSAGEDDYLDVCIELQEDGVWQVWAVRNDFETICFRRYGFYEDYGFAYYSSRPYLLDITKLSWGALPRTFAEAMAASSTDFWWMCVVQYAPVYAAPDESSSILMLLDARTPVYFYAQQQDWMQVTLPGREELGWIRCGNLLPGSIQDTWYARWLEDSEAYGAKEIILEAEDEGMIWYAAAHDPASAEPLHIRQVETMACLGWCPQGCCTLLYSEEAGASGFVPTLQLPYIPD